MGQSWGVRVHGIRELLWRSVQWMNGRHMVRTPIHVHGFMLFLRDQQGAIVTRGMHGLVDLVTWIDLAGGQDGLR